MNESISIKGKLSVNTASALTKFLYKKVVLKDLCFELKAKEGSLLVDFLIQVGAGLTVVTLSSIVLFVWKQLKKEKENGFHVNAVTINNYIITGSKEDNLPKEIKRKIKV